MKDEILKGNKTVLSKAITLVESEKKEHREEANKLMLSLLPHTGKSLRVGISGTPGVGKSTFIESLGMNLIDLGHKVAVLAIDPSSQKSGGSILGDKTRMTRLSAEEKSFIRPTPSRGDLGGVALSTHESILLCEAAGFDIVLIETVGVGQSEVEVNELCDQFVLLLGPGGGDELQGIKRGILEFVDFIVVNKADGALEKKAQVAAHEYKSALEILRSDLKASDRVFLCSALENKGLDKFWQALEQVSAKTNKNLKRAGQLQYWYTKGLEACFKDYILSQGLDKSKDVLKKLEEGKSTPLSLAKESFKSLLG
jgi:LAO/AO transport system kinase